jgi:putative ABC transport system substrate-binding protein
VTSPLSPARPPAPGRRAFLGSVGAALIAYPLGASAQQPLPDRSPRVGVLLGFANQPTARPYLRDALSEQGWVVNRNIILEARYANGQLDRLPALASELVALGLEMIVAVGDPAIRAARDATTTIPIVMGFGSSDPVKSGFVASLARPGGNVTGLTALASDLNTKRLDLLKQALPDARRIALLSRSDPSLSEQVIALRTIAPSLGAVLEVVEVNEPGGYDAAFSTIKRARADALVVLSDSKFFQDRRRLISLAAKTRLPAAYELREFADDGGLMSYGPNIFELYRRVAVVIDKILKGAKPADLPVEQPTKFELVINLKTAKTLGVAIPQSVLLRADQVIE